MGHDDVTSLHREQICHVIGDYDASMTASCTADRDHEIGFAFCAVQGDEIGKKLGETIEKGLGLGLFEDVLPDLRTCSVKRAKSRIEIGIRQEPDVENEARFRGNTVFESKGKDMEDEMVQAFSGLVERKDFLPELVDIHCRGVEDTARTLLQTRKAHPFESDCLQDVSFRHQRMGPSRLAESPEEDIVSSVEKEYLHVVAVLLDLGEDGMILIEEGGFPHVHHQGDLGWLMRRAIGKGKEFGKEDDGKIVHAEIAQVLECL